MNKVGPQELEAFAAPILTGLGYELVDLEWKHEAGAWVLRLYIDFPASVVKGSTVSHEDCARASHLLSAELDVADLIHVPFHLEVSSPGLNRALRREGDFQRFVGRKVRIRTRHLIVTDSEGVEASCVATSSVACDDASGQGSKKNQHDAPGAPGRRNFAGLIVGTEGGRVRVDVDGRIYEIPVDDVEKANLQFEL